MTSSAAMIKVSSKVDAEIWGALRAHDLTFERVDPIFGFTPRRGESMNVGICTALREGRGERPSK